MLEFRLKAYKKWLTMEEPDWSDNRYPRIDYNAYYYYSEPKQKVCVVLRSTEIGRGEALTSTGATPASLRARHASSSTLHYDSAPCGAARTLQAPRDRSAASLPPRQHHPTPAPLTATPSQPALQDKKLSLDEVDPELLKTFDKLGIPLNEQKRLSNVAVDAVFDSVSIATTFREELGKAGVIFCSFSEAVKDYPELIKKYMGSVVPVADNYFAALNSAVFSDGSFVYIPKGVRSPMELSTYFRINAQETGQFERTLIVAEDDSYVSYLEGCTAPAYDENQLHAAVVELYTGKNAEIKYSTVQNWYAGNEKGIGGIYNFVTKRGLCKGANSKISWTQVETGSSITWKVRGHAVLPHSLSSREILPVCAALSSGVNLCISSSPSLNPLRLRH